jgi:epoxyqueuosine reductase
LLSTKEITHQIKEKALALGFNACGVVPAKSDTSHLQKFISWLNKSNHANMQYLESNINIRKNPDLLVDNAKSIIVLLSSYNKDKNDKTESYKIARYALSRDYHIVLKEKMNELLEYVETFGNISGRCFVDSAPILERSYAYNSGLGFIGKNTCLINKDLGSWVFISSLIIDAELFYENKPPANKSYCKNCNLCIQACPTGALKPYEINCNLCISYHTIENREKVPEFVKNKISNQFFGCDICQEVCPYNKDIEQVVMPELSEIELLSGLLPNELIGISQNQFKHNFKETALYRTGLRKLKENLTNINPKKT